MGCGSAKISLTHRRGGGKRRDGDNSDDSDTEAEDTGSGDGGRHRLHQHQLRGSHKVRPASLVTSTSVDSQLLKSSSKRPKITTSFSQNDFSTTTSISGTSRIRVTLSHDGSLLEVETETFDVLEEADDVAEDDDEDDDDPDAIRVITDRPQRTTHSAPVGSRYLEGQDVVYPSCSGTQQQRWVGRAETRRFRSGDSSSESSRAGNDPAPIGGQRSAAAGRCDTEDEEDYDDSTEVTAFIAVAEIEEEPTAKNRATRSKSINSILSQAEESILQELEHKPKKICKECGCTRNPGSKTTSTRHNDGTGSNPGKAKKAIQQILPKASVNPIERTSSATESSDGDIQKDSHSRKSSKSGGSTPYKTASQQKKSEKKKQLPEGASPLAIEKHAECCCYCHHKRKSKVKTKTPTEGDTDSLSSPALAASMPMPRNGRESAPTVQRLVHSNSNNSFSESRYNAAKTLHLEDTLVERVSLSQPPHQKYGKTFWSKHNCEETQVFKRSNSKPVVTKGVKESHIESKKKLYASNDSIVTVPVAPIVDPNAVFNFNDSEWAELALMNGNLPAAKSANATAPPADTTKAKGKESTKKQTKAAAKESRTKRASKLLLSSRSSSFAGNSTVSSRSSGKSSEPTKAALRSAGSSGCVMDMDDGDVTDHSTATTVTSSSSVGDVASMAASGFCDTFDPTAVCLQVHMDFFNDFCDFFDDDDVGMD